MELVIAEKPSVAQSIAAVLGATQRKDGLLLHKVWDSAIYRMIDGVSPFFMLFFARRGD